jgi:hypothetical protein
MTIISARNLIVGLLWIRLASSKKDFGAPEMKLIGSPKL